MAFWDYLVYIKLGGKWLANISQCISKTQEEKGKVTFWEYLRCIGDSTSSLNGEGISKPAKRKAKVAKVKNKV